MHDNNYLVIDNLRGQHLRVEATSASQAMINYLGKIGEIYGVREGGIGRSSDYEVYKLADKYPHPARFASMKGNDDE